MLSYRTQELPLGSASPVLGVMREGLNHLWLSYILQRPIRSVQYCDAETPSRLRFARTRRDEGGIEPPVLSYILQRPIRSVQYCEYVLYRMYYRYHTERRNSLSAPLRPYMRTPSRLRYRGPFVASKYCESTTHQFITQR